jgi:hypothetical protein
MCISLVLSIVASKRRKVEGRKDVKKIKRKVKKIAKKKKRNY